MSGGSHSADAEFGCSFVRCCVQTITSLMFLLWNETDENVLLYYYYGSAEFR